MVHSAKVQEFREGKSIQIRVIGHFRKEAAFEHNNDTKKKFEPP